MIKERNIAMAIVLSLVTCGIYGLYWFVCLTDDMKTASGDEKLPSGGMAVLLTIITCGLYGIYWIYVMAKAEVVLQTKHGLAVKDNFVLYLILQLIGLGVVNYCLIQSNLNDVATKNTQAGV